MKLRRKVVQGRKLERVEGSFFFVFFVFSIRWEIKEDHLMGGL